MKLCAVHGDGTIDMTKDAECDVCEENVKMGEIKMVDPGYEALNEALSVISQVEGSEDPSEFRRRILESVVRVMIKRTTSSPELPVESLESSEASMRAGELFEAKYKTEAERKAWDAGCSFGRTLGWLDGYDEKLRDRLKDTSELVRVVKHELVPIVEMSDEANDPGQELYAVLDQTKDLLKKIDEKEG